MNSEFPPSRIPASSAGFSLVELLVVMVILAIGLLGLMTLQVMNLRGTSVSRGRETATSLARSLLDRIQAEAQIDQMNTAYGIAKPNGFASTYNDPKATTGTTYYDMAGNPVGSSAGAIYTATWSRIAAKGNTPGTSEYQVLVAWSFETAASGKAIPSTITMDRLISR